ncbi:hypothetical protein [Halogeometricum luteum]|uniref:Cupin domain-containing protein n=1 Tax=Halogeometricum luteum TaxID=2950537 RepID=A0ABU2G4L5_9EURY|nr:hypothetical protein [Halogeometricum sp. S3BR5-2]MDS0295741.1 hypothetical protein [Halogeometricum sp. S3BR5-2]
MGDDFAIVDPTDVSKTSFQTCETEVKMLTEPLGATELRVNQVFVDPGEVATPHTHEGQEEVFVAMTGGEIEIEGDLHAVPAGGVVRVGEDVVRNLCNRTGESTQVWLALGAPPVGTAEDFGAYVVADGDDEDDTSSVDETR